MMDAVERYLRLRRSTGFAMSNAECLLASFARFAVERDETHIRARLGRPRAIGGTAGCPTEDGLPLCPSCPR